MPRNRSVRKPPRRAGSPRRSLATAAVALAAVVVAGAVVERLTRPRDKPLEAVRPGERVGVDTAPPQAAPLPEPVTLTDDEVVDEARGLADDLVTSFPDGARAFTASARLCALFGFPEEARARWLRAVELDGGQAEAWLGLAELAHAEGDYARVVECLDRVARLDEALARGQILLRAESRVRMGDAAGALEDLSALGPPEKLPGGALVLRGEALVQLGDHAAAAESYRLAVSDPGQESVARYGLARCLERLGRADEAAREREAYARVEEANLRDFDRRQREAETAAPDVAARQRVVAGYHTEAGSLSAKRRRWDDAERHWRRAVGLAPEMPEPRRFLESLPGR